MADFSSYTHKWRATPAGSHQNDGNKINKRNRQPVSCAPCRARKLKCDRGHPCDACVKRNDDDSCVYGKTAASSTTTTTSARRGGDDSKPNMKAQERLRHLEELVKQMIGPEKNMLTPQTPPTDDQPQPEGSMNNAGDSANYKGSTHWTTVLDQIQELKNTLTVTDPIEDSALTRCEGGREDSLFSAPQPPPIHLVLQRHLPPREECNRYLSTYFNNNYITVPFIHTYQFKRQYEKFWENQLDTSPIWISVLFSILCLADGIRRAPLSLHKTSVEVPNHSTAFLTASAQCLVLGNFAKPQPFIVEALATHCQCKYAVTLDPSHELGLIFAVLVRQVYRMGYHREPSVFGNQFTTFECEMRRRCWSLLRQFDLMVSFQVGLPPIMQADSSDTRRPSHLLDVDFDEDTAVLPPPRPDTEPTQMLYLITKARIMETYGKICQHTLTFPKQPFTSSDIVALDTAINQAIESVPAVLHARPMSLSYADPPNLTMLRSNLMFLGEKARCILHRKYMVSGPDEDDSRRKCINASTRTIAHFLDLHAELQPGGQLFNDRWMLTSFTINDFLLALVVLCLAFSLGRKKFIANGGSAETWLDEDEEAMGLYRTLERAKPVCEEYGTKAAEARRVAEALGLVLAKMRPKNGNTRRQPVGTQAEFVGQPQGLSVQEQEQEDAKMPVDIMPLSIHNKGVPMTGLGMAMFPGQQLGVITPESSLDFTASTTGPLTFSNPTEPSPLSSWDQIDAPLPNILEGPEQIDWVQFDQFLSTYGAQGPMEEEVVM